MFIPVLEVELYFLIQHTSATSNMARDEIKTTHKHDKTRYFSSAAFQWFQITHLALCDSDGNRDSESSSLIESNAEIPQRSQAQMMAEGRWGLTGKWLIAAESVAVI